MIDTHCHLYTKEFDSDIDAVLERAIKSGITGLYFPAIDSSCTERVRNLAARYPDLCRPMAGLHPCSVKEDFQKEIAHVKDQLLTGKFAGIGETGLDFYWDKTFVNEQYEALHIQAALAIKYNLPLILHTRNATQETIDVIKEYRGTSLTGIFHCFGGTLSEAEQIIDLGFSLGIGGVITYKNAGLAEVLADIDIKHLVLETDAPYLSPVPFRGKRNESSYLVHIAEKLATVKSMDVEEIKRITTENVEKIFSAY